MNVRPSILCPVDYSDAAARALRRAAAIADRFVTRLIVLTVEPPAAAAAAEADDAGWTRDASEHEMARFAARVLGDGAAAPGACEYDVAIGRPAAEILRVARERSCALIVMSPHRAAALLAPRDDSIVVHVLHDTTVPVLLTPHAEPDAADGDAAAGPGAILAAIEEQGAARHHLQVAGTIAEKVGAPLAVVQVVEPGGAEVVAGVVRHRRPAVVVVGLHDDRSAWTYTALVIHRALCLGTPVLAVPPPARAPSRGGDRLAAADASDSGAMALSGAARLTLP